MEALKFWRHMESIRFRAIIALAAVVITPLLFVWLSKPYELTISYHMQLIMEQARHDALQADATDNKRRDAQLKAVAKKHGLRVRLINQRGQLLHDHDFTVDGNWSDSFGAVGFSDDQIKRLKRYDLSLGHLDKRAETVEAMAGRAARNCSYSQENKLLVCAMASKLEVKEGPLTQNQHYVLHLQAASPRAIRSLYDVRTQLLKLTGQVFIVALLIGLWLGWRMVSPLKQLRRQVVERAQPPVSTRPVEVKGKDEVTDVAHAFNQLLEAIEAQRQANVGFMADVAHEIKNPVAAIRTCAESMERGVAIDEKRAARYARVLKSSSERLDILVTRFLELARAEAGLENVERVELALGEMTRTVIETFAMDERYEQVEFDQHIDDITMLAAAEPIETALRNLIDNAASFAILSSGDQRVHVSLKHIAAKRKQPAKIVLTIEDTGPGIAPEDLDRIFDRYFTRRADDRGTGLGLAMTRAVVAAHGGEIKVQSTQGTGTTFKLIFPERATS